MMPKDRKKRTTKKMKIIDAERFYHTQTNINRISLNMLFSDNVNSAIYINVILSQIQIDTIY